MMRTTRKKTLSSLSLSNSFAYCPGCKHWVPAKFMHYDNDGGKRTRVCSACLYEAGLLNEPGFTRRGYNYDPEPGSRAVQTEPIYTWRIVGGVPTRVEVT